MHTNVLLFRSFPWKRILFFFFMEFFYLENFRWKHLQPGLESYLPYQILEELT